MGPLATPLPLSIAGAPPQQWLAAPSPVYLTGEEFLRISSLANLAAVTLTITGRVLRPDNSIMRLAFTHAPNSNRTANTTIVALPEGWLLSLTVRASAGSPAFGQVWTLLELGISSGATFTVDQTLGYGFLTTNTPFAWPVSVNTLPLEGPGNLRTITGTQPAAGADITETVPTGARWKLIAFRGLLTTSASAANRTPFFGFDDGSNVYEQISANGVQTANLTVPYSVLPGATAVGDFGRGIVTLPTTVEQFLGAGHRITTSTNLMQAGDQWAAPKYLVREWMVGE